MNALIRATILAIALTGSATAWAEDAAPAGNTFSAPLGEAELKRAAGREDIAQIAQSEQAATVSRNSVGDNSRTGEVQIADNAFQNLSGLSVLNVNTGNNVAVNASMNVNIYLPGQ